MEKYKVCPVCGARNNPLFLECIDCETDLQNVPVVDKGMESAAQNREQVVDAASVDVSMVRICDCGAKNSVQARRCAVCNEDISMIIPTQDTAPGSENTSAAQQYLLASLDEAFAYEIKPGSVFIGRENEMKEYLSSKPYVSRKHAELTLDAAAAILVIKNCNSTNYTFVNNNMLSGDMSAELRDGDEVGLGGNEQNGSRQAEAAYFIVRIGSCI